MSAIRPQLVAVFAVATLGACTMEEPFSGPGFRDGEVTTDAEGPFSVVATHLDVANNNEANAAFNDDLAVVLEEMEGQPGLVGSSLSLVFLSNDEYRTLSVWETEADLEAWLANPARVEAMAHLSGHLDGSAMATYTIDREELPPSWDEAQRHLDDHGHEAY